MDTINDRVRMVRKYLGMTQQAFAKKINLETSNSISMIERGKNCLTEQNIEFICTPNRFKNGITISDTWLRTGDGNMLKHFKSDFEIEVEGLFIKTPDEGELIGTYRQLTEPNKRVAKIQIDALLEGQKLETLS